MNEVTIIADGETLGALITIRGMLDWEIEQLNDEETDSMNSLRLKLLQNARSKVEEWVEDVILVIESQVRRANDV